MTGQFVFALMALVIDRLCGYPDPLYVRIGHPVSWTGRLIGVLDRRLNRPVSRDARLRGVIALGVLLAVVLLTMLALGAMLAMVPGGVVIEAIVAAILLAQKSLGDHVEAVAQGLAESVERGRAQVARIVGRDTGMLDEGGIAKAAIESLAENASDGVVAPLFWLLVAGLPGMALYKAINTADSMIGHLDARYRHFGWAAARLDDLVNLIPARLTGILFVLAALIVSGRQDAGAALRVMRRDAKKHHSLNAGFPEAAMAGALGLSLGGRRAYQGSAADLPTLGEGHAAVSRHDIARALQYYRALLNCLLVIIIALIAASA